MARVSEMFYSGAVFVTKALFVASLPCSVVAEDLIQIYQQALASDPTFAAVGSAAEAIGENVSEARAILLPEVDADYTYMHSDSISGELTPLHDSGEHLLIGPFASTDRSRSQTVTLTEPVLDWAAVSTLRSAISTARSAEAGHYQASQNLLVRTAAAYFGVLSAEEQCTLARLNEAALAQQVEQARRRFSYGLLTATDVTVARAQHDAAVANVIVADTTADTARERVSEITGTTFGLLKKLREPFPAENPVPANLEAWVDLASRRNPALQALEESVKAAAADVVTQRSGHLPSINGTVGRSVIPSWSGAGNRTTTSPLSAAGNGLSTDNTLQLTFDLPIFTGGLVSAKTKQAGFQLSTAQTELVSERRLVSANVRNAYRAVIAGVAEISAGKSAVISAQRAVEATQAGFKIGTKTILDVLTSQAALLQAQSSYSQVRHTFVLSGLLLKEAAGVVTLGDLQTVNALLE